MDQEARKAGIEISGLTELGVEIEDVAGEISITAEALNETVEKTRQKILEALNQFAEKK